MAENMDIPNSGDGHPPFCNDSSGSICHHPPSHYNQRITSTNQGTLIFLIDTSESMGGAIAGCVDLPKAHAARDCGDAMAADVIKRCPRRDDGTVKNYFEVGVFQYGAEKCVSLFGQPLLTIEELNKRVKFEDRLVQNADGSQTKRRVATWMSPAAYGGTPMRLAFETILPHVAQRVKDHPDSYPPVVVNITDGMPTDGDPSVAMAALRHLSTSNGNVLLLNVHLSSNGLPGKPIRFPKKREELPDEYAKLLYDNSSYLTSGMVRVLREKKYDVNGDSRLLVFNAGIQDVLLALSVGTPRT